jgi:ribosomal protein L5
MRADQTTATLASAAEQQPGYTYAKKKDTRWWEVRDPAGELVCLTVYRRGAREVVRRLSH